MNTDILDVDYTRDIFNALDITPETDKDHDFVDKGGNPYYVLSHSGPEAVGLAIKLIEICKKREDLIIREFNYYQMSSGYKWIVTPWRNDIPEGKSPHLSHALQSVLQIALGIPTKE